MAIPISDTRTRDILQSINNSNLTVRLLCSDATQAPIAVGIFRNAIILPAGYGKWSSDRLHVVLMHELTHIRRYDVFAQSVARVACILYWFNPLAWQAARRMRLERELACDDAMLCAGENANDYAVHLVEIASAVKTRWRAPQGASAMATQRNLQTRVLHILQSDLDRRLVSKRASALLTAMAIAFVALLTATSPTIATAPENGPAKTEADTAATEFTLAGDAPADWLKRLNAMPNVRKLTIHRPNLKSLQVTRLKDLQQLTAFRAEDFPLGSRLADAVAVNVANLPRLRSVTFDRTGLTNRGLQLLQDSSIAELTLTEEEFLTDDAFEYVARMKSLRKLVLDATPIEVAGLKHLQHCPQLRSFALRRHPAGSSEDGADGRLAAIAGLDKLEELELESTAYARLVVFKQIASLKQLTLRRCGALEASQSLKQLKQLDKLVLDDCDIRNETLGDVSAILAEVGIEVVDAIRQARTDLLARGSSPVSEATKLARQLHDELDVAKHHPAFWIRWRSFSNDVPSMKSEPVRTLYRLKKALLEDHVRRRFAQDLIMAWAPQRFYIFDATSTDGVVGWEQVKYGDAKVAWAREGRPDDPPRHFIRNGVSEFVDTFFSVPRQL
ncbi:MAG: M56 family metallopeptidase, partial [Gemmatimonadales bacterium]